MGYRSRKSTKQKRNLYNLFERYKSRGTVPIKPIREYIRKKGLQTARMGDRSGRYFEIGNKKGTRLVFGTFMKKKNRIKSWVVS